MNRRAGIGTAILVLAAALGLASGAFAQPPCPPGFHFQPGAGCVRNPPPPPPPAPAADLMIVSAKRLKLRQCPTPQCLPVAVLSRGTPVRVLGIQEGWARVRAPQTGLEGWVQRRFLSY